MIKWISILVLGVAILAAAGAAVYVASSNESEALALAQAAESKESKARAAQKKAEAEERTAKANAEAEKAKAEAEKENRIAAEANEEANRLAQETAEIKAEAAENDRIAKAAEAKAAFDLKEAEKIKAKAAKEESDAAQAVAESAERTAALNAQAEADKLAREKLRSDAIVAEVKLLELRKIDFETIERTLIEYQQELDERERALHPDKTAADLTWVGEAEADVIGAETNKLRKAVKVLPENDPNLPKESRELARRLRLAKEEDAKRSEETKRDVATRLEALYQKAREEDRVIDAEYYYKTLKTLYPDWEAGKMKNER